VQSHYLHLQIKPKIRVVEKPKTSEELVLPARTRNLRMGFSTRNSLGLAFPVTKKLQDRALATACICEARCQTPFSQAPILELEQVNPAYHFRFVS